MTGKAIFGIIRDETGISMTSDNLNALGWTGEELTQAMRILGSLPPAKPQKIITEPMETCACGKKVPVASLEEINTGVFKIIGDVCKGCKSGQQLDREYARVVCCRCKRVITRIKPARDKTGFTFVAGKTYHLSECGLCNPDIQRCPIIEKVLWDRKRKS